MARALTSAKRRTSAAVYATIVGLPRVPEEPWIRTVSRRSAASVPNGYASRSSAFVVSGSASSGSSGETPSSVRRQYGESTRRSRSSRSRSRARWRAARSSGRWASSSGWNVVPLPDEPEALEGEERIDELDRPRVRRDQVGEAARRDHPRLRAELLADPVDDPVHLTREAVDEPRAERGLGRLADHGRRLLEVDLDQPRGASEERLHRDLDPRRQDAADVLAGRGDDVEVRRRAEVDDDDRRAVALACGDRVRNPVRPDLARRVVPQGDPGADPRPDDEERRLRPALRELLVLAHEPRHRRGEADAGERAEVEEAPVERAELVAGAVRLGRDSPVLRQAIGVVEPEDGLRVPDVDREQHAASLTLTNC